MSDKRLATFVSVVAASLLATTPAAAASAGGNSPPPATVTMNPPKTLALTVNAGEHVRPDARSVMLQCDPADGDHPERLAACSQLGSKRGKVGKLNVHPDQPCVLRYAPVTVTATGTWAGAPVHYQKTFGNSCTLHAKTGAVFRF